MSAVQSIPPLTAAVAEGYRAQRTFAGTPEAVFAALTSPEAISRWWAPCTLTTDGRLRFLFGDAAVVIDVTAAQASRHVRWSVTVSEPLPDWVGTHIDFTLSLGRDGGTVLDFCHEGLTDQLECFDMCRAGWAQYLPSLVDHVDRDAGTPFGSQHDKRAAHWEQSRPSATATTATTAAETTVGETEDFTAVLTLPAGPGTVSALFASAAGVSRWWGPTEGDAAVGGTLVTSFGEHGVNAMRVLEAGPARVVWQSVALEATTPTGHTQEWLNTTMEFDIRPAPTGNATGTSTGTELRFRHAGLTPQLECWDACFAAWTYFMTSIEAAATTGTGTPFVS